jgi:D-alanyl-lipoteichoic acid acyltransferase DltB (MBOAT superfamily)
MAVDSLRFFLFVVACLAIFYVVKQGHRKYILLLASFLFLFFNGPASIILILLSSVFNFYAAKAIERNRRSLVLRLCVAVNVIFLFSFKYLSDLIPTPGGETFFSRFIIPLGISYYTFQYIGYLLDIFYKRVNAPQDYRSFLLYAAYFPKITAGPIEDHRNFHRQADQLTFDYSKTVSGLQLVLWGLFKKIVVADQLGAMFNFGNENVAHMYGISVLIYSVIYLLYVYANFSGYTDMVIGVSLLFGIKLSENFNAPYIAKSVSDFWRRWHMSLSRWLNNYVYKYVSYLLCVKNSLKKTGLFLSILSSFIIIGVWHGLTVNYLCFGIIQSVFIFFEPQVEKTFAMIKNGKVQTSFKWIYTMMFFCLSFLFLSTPDLSKIVLLFENLFQRFPDSIKLMSDYYYRHDFVFFQLDRYSLIWVIVPTTVMLAVDYYKSKFDSVYDIMSRLSKIQRWGAYYTLIVTIILCSNKGATSFIYRNF